VNIKTVLIITTLITTPHVVYSAFAPGLLLNTKGFGRRTADSFTPTQNYDAQLAEPQHGINPSSTLRYRGKNSLLKALIISAVMMVGTTESTLMQGNTMAHDLQAYPKAYPHEVGIACSKIKSVLLEGLNTAHNQNMTLPSTKCKHAKAQCFKNHEKPKREWTTLGRILCGFFCTSMASGIYLYEKWYNDFYLPVERFNEWKKIDQQRREDQLQKEMNPEPVQLRRVIRRTRGNKMTVGYIIRK